MAKKKSARKQVTKKAKSAKTRHAAPKRKKSAPKKSTPKKPARAKSAAAKSTRPKAAKPQRSAKKPNKRKPPVAQRSAFTYGPTFFLTAISETAEAYEIDGTPHVRTVESYRIENADIREYEEQDGKILYKVKTLLSAGR
jgi:hypothetical protein